MDEKIRNAEQAHYILTHPLVVGAFADINEALSKGLSEVSEKDLEGMKNLVLTKKCLDRFKRAFERHIETGKLAENEFQQKRGILSRFK